MAISLKSLTRKADPKPPRITIYGVEGVGKTTLAACAPNPVFIWTEEGQGVLDVNGFPVAQSFDDVMGAIQALYEEEHEFSTVVVDTLDWLEPMIWQSVCAEHGVDTIERVLDGYGKGYGEALKLWRNFIKGLDLLREEKGMAVILVAHSTVKRFESPETDPYDRWQIKIHDKASALIRENSDVVAFANYDVHIRSTDVGFNKEARRGVSSGKRYLYFVERPAFQAKNRYAMPDKLVLDIKDPWSEFASHLPGGENFGFAAEEDAESEEESKEEAA